MVTANWPIVLVVDGAEPISPGLVGRVGGACDRAESGGGRILLRLSGSPAGDWLTGVTVGLVSKWERALRRLERVPAATVAVVDGECGGVALDALLAADFRIGTPSVRLRVPVATGATWPGMAVYRLAGYGPAIGAVRRAVLFGEPIAADEALRLNLLDRVTADAESALAEFAGATAGLTGAELAVVRQLMFDAASTEFEAALGAHLAACDRALRRSPGWSPA